MNGSVAYSLGLLLLCVLHACAVREPIDPVDPIEIPEKKGTCPPPPGKPICLALEAKPARPCSIDQQCPGEDKCCNNGCIFQCKTPLKVVEKEGTCPQAPSYPICLDLVAKPVTGCSTDRQCPGEDKCCYYGCNFQCKTPLKEKLGFCKDYDRASCFGVKPLRDECKSDDQCPGTTKCCCSNCRRACSETVKSGTCPPKKANCAVLLAKPKCKDDSGCPGRQKCCSQCGDKCTDPEPENPGVCPVDPQMEAQCGFRPSPLCSRDAECAPNEKCCRFGCRVQCVKSLPAKAGVCPIIINIMPMCQGPPDAPQCQSDSDCPSSMKCCESCGNKCLNPLPVHNGFCPAFKPVTCDLVKFVSECSQDANCKDDEKCCDVGCKMACRKSIKEKSGKCPIIRIDESAKDMCNKCNDDKDCPGKEKCCAGAKGRKCQDPQPDKVIVKPGNCPHMNLMCIMPPPPGLGCEVDSDCLGKLKCCNTCGMQCVAPN